MILSHAAYWLSLADREELPTDGSGTQTVAIQMPKRNLLTVDSLTDLVRGDADGVRS